MYVFLMGFGWMGYGMEVNGGFCGLCRDGVDADGAFGRMEGGEVRQVEVNSRMVLGSSLLETSSWQRLRSCVDDCALNTL